MKDGNYEPGDRVKIKNNIGPDLYGTVVDPATFPPLMELRERAPEECAESVAQYELFVNVDRTEEGPLPEGHGRILNIRAEGMDRVTWIAGYAG